jgi:ATP-dependent Zn protease
MSQAPMPPYQPPGVMQYADPSLAPKRNNRGWIGWVLFVGLAVVLFFTLQRQSPRSTAISLSEFVDQLSARNVAIVVVDGDTLRGDFARPASTGGAPKIIAFRTELPTGSGTSWAFMQWLLDNAHGASIQVDNSGNWMANLLVPLIPWIVIFLFIWFFLLRNLRKNQAKLEAPRPVYIVNPESRP